ncbi:MAG: hypothetical protein VX768_05725, partial [Planctomycetota bacterium]|nr:hypothetical protein [Planctomycetota bacterium]
NGFWVDPVEITLESIEQSLSGDYIPGISPEGGPQSGEQPMDPLPPVGDPQANRFPGDRGGFSGYRSTTQRGGENRFPGTNHLRERGRFTETSNFTGTTSGELVTYPERAQAGAGSGKVFRSSESLIAGRPPKRKTDTRSLYSNFDRDRKVSRPGNRAEADSTPRRTATRIRTRKIVDRRVNRATHDQEQAPPRIAPFPFQLKN